MIARVAGRLRRGALVWGVVVGALSLPPATATAAPSFASPLSFPTDDGPSAIAIADLNADTRPDLAVANRIDDNVSVLLATPAGGFAPATNYAVGDGPVSLAAGDLNGDARPDLVTANLTNTVSVLLANGSGGFAAATDFPAGDSLHAVAIGELNGDAHPDLAVADWTGDGPPGEVSVLAGNGLGGFSGPTAYAVGDSPNSVAIGDLNGDSLRDLVVANVGDDDVSVLLADGSGGFAGATDYPAGDGPVSVALADLNGDARLDLAAADVFSDQVSVMLGNGTGGFGAPAGFDVGSGPRSVAVGDLNADARPDLVVANVSSDNVSYLLGNGSGGFAAATSLAVGDGPVSVATGDLGPDGRTDIATANEFSNNASVLLNTSEPDAQPSPSGLDFGSRDVGSESSPQTVVIANEGDARLDITDVRIVGANPGDFRIHSDNCAGDTLLVGQSCQVLVRFEPIAEGTRSADLRVISNDPASPQTIPLTGTGTPDTSPPAVEIISGPSGLTRNASPSFGFGANEEASFACSLDGSSFVVCGSPFNSPALADGPHVFTVRGTDDAGNSASVSRSFDVDTRPPELRIASGPAKKVRTRKRTARVRFAVETDEQANLECRLDDAAFAPCAGAVAYKRVRVGRHVFEVRATDAVGNEQTISRKFKVVRKR